MTTPNRRKHERAPLNLLLQHRFESYDAFTSDTTLDLSEGGLFLRTKTPRPVGSQVYFQLMLESGAPLVEGLGRVVRVVEPNKAGVPSGVGVQFVNLDERSREVIRDAVKRSGR